MTGLTVNRMRNTKALKPDLEQLVLDYVVSNNLLGGTVTDASLTHEAMDAFKTMQQAGRLSNDIDFKASTGWVTGFKRRFNLTSLLRCNELSSADQEGVILAKNAVPKVLAELRISQACNVWKCDEIGLRWVAPPDRAICDRRPEGFKKAMDGITVLVACNAGGTGKRSYSIRQRIHTVLGSTMSGTLFNIVHKTVHG